MKALPRFPAYGSGACDFINKRIDVEPGEQVLCLDVEVEALPEGMLCVHQDSVANMVQELGWQLLTPATVEEMIELRAQLDVALALLDDYEKLNEMIDKLSKPAPTARTNGKKVTA